MEKRTNDEEAKASQSPYLFFKADFQNMFLNTPVHSNENHKHALFEEP